MTTLLIIAVVFLVVTVALGVWLDRIERDWDAGVASDPDESGFDRE